MKSNALMNSEHRENLKKKNKNYACGHEQNAHIFSNRINYDYGSTKRNTRTITKCEPRIQRAQEDEQRMPWSRILKARQIPQSHTSICINASENSDAAVQLQLETTN